MSEEKKKQTMSVYIQAKKDSWENDYSYSASTWDLSNSGYIPVDIVQVEYTVATQEELLSGHVKLLQKKIDVINSDAFMQMQALKEEIQSLLAIGVTADE